MLRVVQHDARANRLVDLLRDRIVGRTALDDVIDPVEGRVIVETGAEINEDVAAEIQRSGVQRVRIVAGNYFFKPNHIIVKVNRPVELTTSREAGMVPHDLVIRAEDAGIVVD